MTKRTRAVAIRLRVDLDPGHSIGPGKITLLEHIERSGSLSQAARELDMSYRRAWLLLDDLNHAFTQPVTTTSVGGAGGGGAQLTAFGRKVIAAYRGVEQAAGELASEQLEWLLNDCAAASAANPTPRQRLARRLARASPRAPRTPSSTESPPETRARVVKRP